MAVMAAERFVDRVAALHASWVERRDLKHIAADHTFDPQFELLRLLHAWAVTAAADLRQVFGGNLPVEVLPSEGEDLDRSVQFVVADRYSVTFALVESYELHQPHWRVAASVRLPRVRTDAPVKPHQRSGIWTRREFEDTLLALLTAYERDSSA